MKLLKAYEELDGQPSQGENIVNSKKEIEDTLDTIDQAFEKLLDSFFEEAAWDISSDISGPSQHVCSGRTDGKRF